MADPILFDNLEKAPTESNLSITSNDINIELTKEFLVELRMNIHHGTYNEDVVDHIVKVLKMVDLIYVPGVDSHQLRMKVFPFSLADDAKECVTKEITTWEELVEKFFYRFYPESYDGEDDMLEEEKARRRGKVYNWETATYGKVWYDEDVHNLRSVETEFPAIVLNDALTSEVTPSYEPTASPLNDNEIDFRISFD
ncbi:hypothetical protein Tco_1105196 [Tanacetum coccineum]